jgi:hypothetical protein
MVRDKAEVSKTGAMTIDFSSSASLTLRKTVPVWLLSDGAPQYTFLEIPIVYGFSGAVRASATLEEAATRA